MCRLDLECGGNRRRREIGRLVHDQVGIPRASVGEQSVDLCRSIQTGESPGKRMGSPLVERNRRQPLAKRRVALVQLHDGEARREHVEAEVPDPVGKAARRHEDDLVTAVDEGARQWDERDEMAVGGTAREEDAHAATLSREP